MKTLAQIWSEVPAQWAQIVVPALVSDSRQVRAGSVFVALAALHHDARSHIPAALAAGAGAVLAEAGGDWLAHAEVNGVPVLVVADLTQRLGEFAARFHDQPAQAMTVMAVTGTNGKTSIANLIAGAALELGQRSAVIGTLGNGFYGELAASQFTTPDPLQLQGLLAGFRDQGAQLVAMEASSHGLEQGRMVGTPIHTALFTNLTRDHLDYHGDMASYAAAKGRLFSWPGLKAAVINADDAQGALYQQQLAVGVRCLCYSLQADSDAEIVAESVQPSLSGLLLHVRTPWGRTELRSPLLGRFNASNLLAVLGGLLTLGYSLEQSAQALSVVAPVAGRMQCLREGQSPLAVVDYAHTPDALEQALKAAREHTEGKLWCVFGCGGGRDTGKRSEMGRIAATLADVLVLTTDNPREEAPESILQDIQQGLNGRAATIIVDRAEAIAHALKNAASDDVVLIAGKGHETYQEVMGVRYPFNDVEQVRLALNTRSTA
ncbi:MAG: UDP-N-acetylmuramoyl-L-alanyl-D-glutamate--2,6-diaminopimelate ligase [Pseudomonadota bacterium]